MNEKSDGRVMTFLSLLDYVNNYPVCTEGQVPLRGVGARGEGRMMPEGKGKISSPRS